MIQPRRSVVLKMGTRPPLQLTEKFSQEMRPSKNNEASNILDNLSCASKTVKAVFAVLISFFFSRRRKRPPGRSKRYMSFLLTGTL